MGWRFKQGLRSSCALVLACTAVFAVSGATAGERMSSLGAMPNDRIAFVEVGEPTRAPIGWVEFCVEYHPECKTRPSMPRDVVFTPKAWADMVKVNNWA